MKKIIRFSKVFLPAAIISTAIAVTGITAYVMYGGFNLGVDFQAGLIQEVQFAPTAFNLTYNGTGNASVLLSHSSLDIVISGAGVEETTHSFTFASYPVLADLLRGLQGVEGLVVSKVAQAPSAASTIRSSWLVQSAQGNPLLDAAKPFIIHYLPPDAKPVLIEDVRASLLPLGSVAVQMLGAPAERRYMIRMEDKEISGGKGVPAEKVIAALESSFGQGEVAVTRSDYVGSRFSKDLTNQVGILISLTLLLMLIYMAFRFKLHYAFGSILGIMNDGLVMVTFIVLTRMEFNTSTIAAILTILGYSINSTIVVFDRVRENRRIFPDDPFVTVLNRSLTGTLSRTIITTTTTMLAVVFLYIFTTGSMKDFALALLVGLTSGVYTTLFIASGFVNFWEKQLARRAKKKLKVTPAKVPAKA